jgi:hypothetical protein
MTKDELDIELMTLALIVFIERNGGFVRFTRDELNRAAGKSFNMDIEFDKNNLNLISTQLGQEVPDGAVN